MEDGYELREYSFGPLTIATNVNPVESLAVAN